jgi:hypothetical protein
LIITIGYDVPALSAGNARGTTKTISYRFTTLLTDFKPHATPFIETVKWLNSIGSVKLLCSDPTAVRAVIAGAVGGVTCTTANIPGDNPRTALGVTGVGVGVGEPVGVGDGVGVGVGVGVAVGLGVGVGDGLTARRLAPVAKLNAAVCSCGENVGVSR